MKFTYRGVTHSYNPPKVKTPSGEVGQYQNLDWRFRNLKKPPVLQPRVELTYRGVHYSNGTLSTYNSTESAETSALSTQEKARSLAIEHQQSHKNRQQSMLYRAAAEVGLEVSD